MLVPTATNAKIAQYFRYAVCLLLLLYISALLASLLPASFGDAGWYLSANDRLIANAPIIITASCLWWFAQAIAPLQQLRFRRQMRVHVKKIAWLLFTLLFWIHALALPIELVAGSHLLLRMHAIHHANLERYQDQQSQIGQRLQTATTRAELEALLPPKARQPNSRLSMESRRSDLQRALRADELKLKASLAGDLRRRRIRLIIDMIRVVAACFPIALFFQMFSRDYQIDEQIKRLGIR